MSDDPGMVVYATQYIDDAGANQYFVPTNKVQFIAGRDSPLTGATAMAQMKLGGEFASTLRSLMASRAPGPASS